MRCVGSCSARATRRGRQPRHHRVLLRRHRILTRPAPLLPHGDTVVLGGTAQPGQWSREPDPDTAAAIVARCAEVEPRLRDARIIEHRVADYAPPGGTRIIHNYGHGGAGLTLSWGCALEIAYRT